MKILAIVLAVIGGISHAQINVTPAQIPHQTFYDQSGSPCAGCSLFSYSAGTTTPTPTFTDNTGTSQNTNPIVLGVNGSANIWVPNVKSLKLVLKDTLGSTIWSVDGVIPSGRPCPTPNALAYTNATGDGFSCDPAITVDPATHTLNITGTSGNFNAKSFNNSYLLSATTPMIDVRAYGAVCNSGLDETAHLQAAINAGSTIGGIVYFPPCTFAVNGPVQSSCNGIICIPVAPQDAATQVRLQGTTKNRQDENGTSLTGTVITSTQNSPFDFDSAIIAVPMSAGGFNNADLYVSDIDFRTYPDPNIGCINATWSAGADIEHIRCEVGESFSGSTKTKPTHHINAILLPGVNNDTLAVFKYSEVSGYETGIVASEHSDIEESTFSFGVVGVNYQSGFHTANSNLMQLQDVGTPILFTGGPLPVNAQGLDIQYDPTHMTCPAIDPWCFSGTDISDVNNYGFGHMSYAKVTDFGAVGGKLVKIGAGGIDLYDMYNNEWTFGNVGQRATVTARADGDPHVLAPSFAGEYFDMDLLLGARTPTDQTDPARRMALQVVTGGSGNTPGTTPGNLDIQTNLGSGTNIGNTGSDIIFGYIGKGKGFEVVTGPGCSYTVGAIGNSCNVDLTLPVVQLDTNYQITGCQVANTTFATFTGSPVVSSVLTQTVTTVTVTISSLSITGTGGGTVSCLLTHDAF